ncbi:hypothetical protein B0H11DRAFT_1921923 [Mycena galericulata]|nr:hypothetical protein B0H11DRAFT_1921923 [Mycena galericulata]
MTWQIIKDLYTYRKYNILATPWNKVLCQLLLFWWRTRAIFCNHQIGHIAWKRNAHDYHAVSHLWLLGFPDVDIRDPPPPKTPNALKVASWNKELYDPLEISPRAFTYGLIGPIGPVLTTGCLASIIWLTVGSYGNKHLREYPGYNLQTSGCGTGTYPVAIANKLELSGSLSAPEATNNIGLCIFSSI